MLTHNKKEKVTLTKDGQMITFDDNEETFDFRTTNEFSQQVTYNTGYNARSRMPGQRKLTSDSDPNLAKRGPVMVSPPSGNAGDAGNNLPPTASEGNLETPLSPTVGDRLSTLSQTS